MAKYDNVEENIDREALFQSALGIIFGHLFADMAACEYMVEEDRDDITVAKQVIVDIHEKYRRP